MVDLQALLAGRAFETIDGATYNRFRERRAERAGEPETFYEIPIPDGAGWSHVAEKGWPDLARWLSSRKLDAEDPGAIIVAAFLGPRCYLLRGEAFRDLFCEVEGLGRAAFHFRVERWLSQ